METVWQNIMAAAGGLDGGGALANALGASQVQLGSAQLGVAQMSALNLGAQAAQAQQAIGAAQLGYPGGLSAFLSMGSTGLVQTPPSMTLSGMLPTPVPKRDEAHEQAIGHVQELSQSDPEAQAQWNAYCDLQGGGKRDPAKHPLDFIQGWLANYHAGARLPIDEDLNIEFSDALKILQRKSMNFKTAWSNYCLQYGKGVNDPTKHEHSYHVEFLEGIAEKALSTMAGVESSSALQAQDDRNQKRRKVERGPPPGVGEIISVKCTKGGKEPHQGVGYLDDGTLVVINNAVEFIGGVCPSAKVLSQRPTVAGTMLFAKYWVPGMKESWGDQGDKIDDNSWNPSSWSSWDDGGAAAQTEMDLKVQNVIDREKLVNSVKTYQRNSEAERDAWWSYCDQNLNGFRDPAKHTAEALQQFVTAYGVPLVEAAPPPNNSAGWSRTNGWAAAWERNTWDKNNNWASTGAGDKNNSWSSWSSNTGGGATNTWS